MSASVKCFGCTVYRALCRLGLGTRREPNTDPYSTETLLRAKATECAELRELLVGVAQELERLACEHPDLASRLLARAMRLRRRVWEASA